MSDDTVDWASVAGELAGALRATMVRHPNLNARDWARASAALERYDGADGGVTAELREPPEP